MLVMETMKRVADRYGLQLLLHEKPFAGVNGSGKHLNWSMSDDQGNNLLKPGDTPHDNAQFLVFLAAVLRAVARHGDLLRVAVAHAGNDHRLGANEAPPAIISIFLGDMLQDIVEQIEKGGAKSSQGRRHDDRSASRSCRPCPATPATATGPARSPSPATSSSSAPSGSSQSIAGPNVVLNTIVAESLDEIATQLEKAVAAGKDLNAEIQALLPKLHRREQEGHLQRRQLHRGLARRGRAARACPTAGPPIDSLPDLISPKSVALFGKYGVFTERELHSRYEILLENYKKTINIESQLTIQIANRHDPARPRCGTRREVAEVDRQPQGRRRRRSPRPQTALLDELIDDDRGAPDRDRRPDRGRRRARRGRLLAHAKHARDVDHPRHERRPRRRRQARRHSSPTTSGPCRPTRRCCSSSEPARHRAPTVRPARKDSKLTLSRTGQVAS